MRTFSWVNRYSQNMLRSIVHGVKRFNFIRGSPRDSFIAQCVNSGTKGCFQNQQTINYCTDYTDYVVIDFSKRDFDDDTSTDLDVKTISPNLESNPKFVYLEGIQERHYWGKIRSLMRGLGYKGYLEDLRHGRGKGIFIRNDVADLVKPYGGTVYRSKRPNPL
nr:uncharacterized protein LOC105329156 [Crassostrea gigas]